MKLSVSSPEVEGPFQAAKWMKLPVLCDLEELRALFSLLEPFAIFPLSSIGEGAPISAEFFLNTYGSWIEMLQKGEKIVPSELKKILAACFVREKEDLWLQEIPNKGFLVKLRRPALHVQAHFFTHSQKEGKFYSMTLGPEAIFWGLQFSFAQIYQDGKTLEMKKSQRGVLFPIVQKWAREFTRPAPFFSTIRLGKNCFSWIENYTDLKTQNVRVYPR